MSGSAVVAAGGVVWLISIFVAASVQRRSLQRLTAEEKVRLVDAASSSNRYSTLAFIAVVACTFATVRLLPTATWQIVTAALGASMLLGLISSYVTFRRLQTAGMPDHFLRSFKLSRALRFLAAALLFAGAILSIYSYRDDRWVPDRHSANAEASRPQLA